MRARWKRKWLICCRTRTKKCECSGESLKKAATSAAYNVNAESLRDLVDEIRKLSPELGARAEQELLHEVRVAPTLVKYADPNPYEMETRRELRQAARELMKSESVAPSKAIVDLLDEEPLEVEIATTLLYEHCHYSYRQVRQAVQVSGERFRREIIDIGLRHRGKHDEMLRGFRAGQQFRFDILMDTGGFRDMHRHRRCIQVMQGFTTQHGYEMLLDVEDAGMRAQLRRRDAAHAVGDREARRAQHARGGREFAVRDSAGLSQARPVQDGLRRGRLHLRAAHHAGGPCFLPQRGLRDV